MVSLAAAIVPRRRLLAAKMIGPCAGRRFSFGFAPQEPDPQGPVNSSFKNSAVVSHLAAAADQSTSIARISGDIFTRADGATPGRSGICALGPSANAFSTSADNKKSI